MKQPGLDSRHRDKNGEIRKKHGDTRVGALRQIYGQAFAAGHADSARLSDVLISLNETSLSQLRRDHEAGDLAEKVSRLATVSKSLDPKLVKPQYNAEMVAQIKRVDSEDPAATFDKFDDLMDWLDRP
jgi:hypothetical protein